VTVDVGGETVQLGKTEPIAFEAETVVAVAVPAGPPGVGDVDGTRDERSGDGHAPARWGIAVGRRGEVFEAVTRPQPF